MIDAKQQTESCAKHRAALDRLVEIVPTEQPITVSIDGLPAFDVRNKAARQRLAAALEWVIETEITQLAIDDANAGNTIPFEQVKVELRKDDLSD